MITCPTDRTTLTVGADGTNPVPRSLHDFRATRRDWNRNGVLNSPDFANFLPASPSGVDQHATRQSATGCCF